MMMNEARKLVSCSLLALLAGCAAQQSPANAGPREPADPSDFQRVWRYYEQPDCSEPMRWSFVRREADHDLYALMACDIVVKVHCGLWCGSQRACLAEEERGLIECPTF